MHRPLIVTAELGARDQAWLDGLRRAHFPPARNQLAAHLTMFHALPPSVEGEVQGLLAKLAAERRPAAILAEPYSLGGGVAFRVRSAELEAMRAGLADRFHGSLTAQDGQGWRPHVTIQNKVEPAVARATLAQLSSGFRPRDLEISGLGLYRYAGGPWEAVRRYPFRG